MGNGKTLLTILQLLPTNSHWLFFTKIHNCEARIILSIQFSFQWHIPGALGKRADVDQRRHLFTDLRSHGVAYWEGILAKRTQTWRAVSIPNEVFKFSRIKTAHLVSIALWCRSRAFSCRTSDPNSCIIARQTKEKSCLRVLSDRNRNRKTAVRVSRSATNWSI